MTTHLHEFVVDGLARLAQADPSLYALLEEEHQRQERVLDMVAATSVAGASALICEGTTLGNVTTEGYPGARFHAGCEIADRIETLAIERAKELFRARYANVQPHSGSSANEIVMFSLLEPGDTILGMDLRSGGHLTHGAKVSITGRWFQALAYGVNEAGFIDVDEVRQLARRHRPKLIVAGASAYPRVVDFVAFREIADEVGAYLLADISHTAGLVAAGVHPSPIDVAHFTTMSTYKQLFGPRGGLILMGRDHGASGPDGRSVLSDHIRRGAFPLLQGTPNLGAIAGKARALAAAMTPEFKILAKRIVAAARRLGEVLSELGYRLQTGGTDSHMLVVDTASRGITGAVAERALEMCDVIVNRNLLPRDPRSARVTSAIRIGTNSVAARRMEPEQMRACGELIHGVLAGVEPQGDTEFTLGDERRALIRARVHDLCERFPLQRSFE